MLSLELLFSIGLITYGIQKVKFRSNLYRKLRK